MKKGKNKCVLIAGFGEVGEAVSKLYKGTAHEVHLLDPSKGHKLPEKGDFDIIHICFPCKELRTFTQAVLGLVRNYGKRSLVIIHSTVPAGTTEVIAKSHKYVVHSPVRGVHPNLLKGLKTFVKFVGTDTAGPGIHAAEHLNELGIKTEIVRKSSATELLKLLDTTYYGLAIAYHAYAKKLCDRKGVSFESVMTRANLTYNEGYKKLGKGNVVRPVLYPPEGAIGGHCVIPNVKLLIKHVGKDPILEAIVRHE